MSFLAWGPSSQRMLHEGTQEHSSPELRYESSVFEDLEKQMAEQEAEFSATLENLKRQFIFTNIAPIEAFLRTHRALVYVLLEGVPYLKDCFGTETPLALEIMSDEGPSRSIYALALWRGERKESRAALHRFDEIWWMNNLKKAGGRIVFDYELL